MRPYNAFVTTAKIFHYVVKAELTDKQKERVNKWVDKHKYHRYDGWQDEAFGGRSYGRHIVNIGSMSDPIPVPPEVSQALNKANVQIVDYAKGIGEDNHGRQIRLGKILKRVSPVAAKIFDEDKNRAGAKTNEYQVVFSRLPYDVAGMSTDRGWTSCQDMTDNRKMNKALEYDLKHGTVVAYLCKKGDDTIRNPTARIALKPYYAKGDPDGILRAESTMYGTASDGLAGKFKKAITTWQDEHFKQDPNKTYNLVKGIYNDSLPTKLLSDKAKKKFIKETVACGGGNVESDPDDRKIFMGLINDASASELCAIASMPNAFNILNTMSHAVKSNGNIKNLQEALDKNPASMTPFFTFLNDKQKAQVGEHCTPAQRFKLATLGSNSKADLENLDEALKAMSPEEVAGLDTDLVNSMPFMFTGMETLGKDNPISKSICKNLLLKASPSQVSDLGFYMNKALSKDALASSAVVKNINTLPIDDRIDFLRKIHSVDIPKSVKDKCWKDLIHEIPYMSSQRLIHRSLDNLQEMDHEEVDAGRRKEEGNKVVSSIKKFLKLNGEHFNSRLLIPLEPLIDRDTTKHLLGKVDPLQWNIGLSKDFISKHKLDKDEVDKIESEHESQEDVLKRWIHEQTNPAAIESRFMLPSKRRLSDHIKKVAYDRVRYLRGEHETKASLEKPMNVCDAFLSTANVSCPIKAAEANAKKLTKEHEDLSAKIAKDAKERAAKAGHKPSKDEDAHKAYLNAVDHHIAHHEDAGKATALRKEAASARVAHKRLLRSSKTQASMIPDKKETKAFYKRASEAEAHHAKNVKDLSAQREENTKKANHTFSKIIEDADKKAHAHATKLGHKEGSAGYKKAFSDVHMDHVLAHPDNAKHDELVKNGNHIYGKLKKAQSEHKFAKQNLKNAEKAMKHHGFALPKKTRAKKTTASILEAFS